MAQQSFDVIVVGGGHAGIEAAHAAARLGSSVALAIPNPDTIGLMPCNPAIGGPGKSQIVYELHHLGGIMGVLADKTAIHSRTLNASKGPAVQSLRVQNERDGYAEAARQFIDGTEGISLVRGEISALLHEAGCVTGVELSDGRVLESKAVVLCTGTFLAGVVWYGQQQREAGRQGEAPARYLSESLRATGHELLRFKTGTPPRIRSDSVDFSVLECVPADEPALTFSGQAGERACESPTWLTHTTPETHKLIEANLERSAMYGGQIEGEGPRYCPSIEDKVVRFADKERHLLFVEPDGVDTSEVYLQGFSSSMPPELQDAMIRTLPGFEKAVIQRYAYAVEYDCLDPTQLETSLMSKKLAGMFSAGQINGTSGYEEAAAQGLIAGVNAARYGQELELVTIRRDQGYIGVLLDDIVRWGIDEPYRMLTSRNEYRLLHRQDNAEQRMITIGYDWGMIDERRYQAAMVRQARIDAEVQRLQSTWHEGKLAATWLCRPQMDYAAVVALIGEAEDALSAEEICRIEILVKYHAYIERTQKQLASRQQYEMMKIEHLDFTEVKSLSKEGLGALQQHQPKTLGAASRLRGVRDGDVTALLVYLKRSHGKQAA